MKIAFFTHQTPDSPLEHLRVVGPISHTDIEILMGPELKQNIYNNIDEVDLILIQRMFPADFETIKEIINISRALKKPLVYDFDDNLFVLPENHPDRQTFGISRALMPMLYAAFNADLITVSNDYLKNSLLDLNENIKVLPNYLDDSIWSFAPPKEQNNGKSILIGYMGGDSHKPDLDSITQVLLEIKDKYLENVKFNFYGIKPPDAILSFPDTNWTPIRTYQYSEFAQDFQKFEVDLLIAPLVDNEFNRCKSSIKFLEYSTLGVPGIYSRIIPYTEIVENGKNGLLAGSSEEWKEQIELLINNPSLRRQLADSAQKLVRDKYLMSQNSIQWQKIYQKFSNKGISEQNNNKAPQAMIEAITHQIHEYQLNTDKKLSQCYTELNATKRDLSAAKHDLITIKYELNAREREIGDLKEEVLSYALSNCWRFTRPLRKLKKIVKGRNDN